MGIGAEVSLSRIVRHSIALIFLAAPILAFGCGGEGTGDPRGSRIEGTEPGDCEDGADNDADGLFDCADASCAASPICAGGTGGTDGGVTCDTAQDCDDGNQCTEDTCEPIAAMCAHTPVGDGTDCDLGGSTGVCTAGTCGVPDSEVIAFETSGGGVVSSEQYRMSLSIGGPVGQGIASSTNHQIEFHLPSSQ